MMEAHGVSETRACRLAGLSRTVFRYRASKKDDSEVEAAIRGVARPDEGIDRIFARLRRNGYPWNRKRVLRVYWAMGMQNSSI